MKTQPIYLDRPYDYESLAAHCTTRKDTCEDALLGRGRKGRGEDLEALPDSVTSSLLINRDSFQPARNSAVRPFFGLPTHSTPRKPLIEVVSDDG